VSSFSEGRNAGQERLEVTTSSGRGYDEDPMHLDGKIV